MREIKFRGKCINEDEWAFGSLVQRSGRAFIFEEGVHVPQCKIGDFLTEVIPESVGEFTGLKDKNGREIYEGDILQNKIGVRAKVVFYPEHAAYLASYVFGGNAKLDYLEGDGKINFCEVIGNIYKNPELLEEVVK